MYVPREINLGASELRLEDCINVKDICDKELTKWTADDVARFVRATDCSEYAHVFVDQVSTMCLWCYSECTGCLKISATLGIHHCSNLNA